MWVLVCLNLKSEKKLSPFLKISHEFNVNLPQISCHWWKIINERKDSSEKRHTNISLHAALLLLCLTYNFLVNLLPTLFSESSQPRPEIEVKNTHLLQTGCKCHCFLLFIGSVFWVSLANLRSPFHQNLWNSCFCCLNRLENFSFASWYSFCLLVFFFMIPSVLFFSFVFDEIAFWAKIWKAFQFGEVGYCFQCLFVLDLCFWYQNPLVLCCDCSFLLIVDVFFFPLSLPLNS